jgi:hypothetical protein
MRQKKGSRESSRIYESQNSRRFAADWQVLRADSATANGKGALQGVLMQN